MEISNKIPTGARNLDYHPNLDKFKATPPEGPMVYYLGKRYSAAELKNTDTNEDVSDGRLYLVRAYEVVPLLGVTFQVNTEKEINSALLKIFREKLPGIEWDFEEDWSGPFLKYQILHGSLPMPLDIATNQPMALEIFGGLSEVNGHPLNSAEGRKWLDDRRDKSTACYFGEGGEDAEFSQLYPSISADMVIKIEQATYANVMFPGIGVGLYM